jgi:hypothetical protein
MESENLRILLSLPLVLDHCKCRYCIVKSLSGSCLLGFGVVDRTTIEYGSHLLRSNLTWSTQTTNRAFQALPKSTTYPWGGIPINSPRKIGLLGLRVDPQSHARREASANKKAYVYNQPLRQNLSKNHTPSLEIRATDHNVIHNAWWEKCRMSISDLYVPERVSPSNLTMRAIAFASFSPVRCDACSGELTFKFYRCCQNIQPVSNIQQSEEGRPLQPRVHCNVECHSRNLNATAPGSRNLLSSLLAALIPILVIAEGKAHKQQHQMRVLRCLQLQRRKGSPKEAT